MSSSVQSDVVIDLSSISLSELEDVDDSVLSHALQRFRIEADEAKDPIAAFGAFNQHGSTPW